MHGHGQIVVATCIAIIIQMILPDGKNKKYAEVVAGLYILYVILNPILNLDSIAIFDLQDTISSVVQENYISQDQLARNYILGIENALKDEIEEAGFEVEYIQFYVTQDYSNIAKIEIKFKAGSNLDENKIKEIVLQNFDIGKERIICLKN